MKAMRHVRGYAHDSSKNIKQMWAAGQIEDDPKLIEALNDLAERFRALEDSLSEMKNASHRIASEYLDKHRHAVTKPTLLTRGSPSMRVRRNIKDK
jgi:hypothetical protein